MSGGKETPRQKMIGLMYLVLMALLALNVTKEVLNAFVAIEENVQKGSLTQLDRGEASKADLVEAKNDISPEKVKKVKYFLEIIDKIDKETASRIKEIDNIKLEILKKSGEKVDVEKLNDKETILWKKYSDKEPLKPSRMNLMAVQAKDQFDVPMHEIIGDDLTNITGTGKHLWKSYNSYRNTICDLVGTYSPPGGKTWSFKASDINAFEDNADLSKKVDKMMGKSKFNDVDDYEVLKQLYIELTKNERYNTEELKNIHWIGKTFDHSPLVAAIASLTSLQQEILSARATAVTHIKNRVSTGEYSFNKVVGLAYGQPIANVGDEVELSVMMAAFDSDNQPTITGPGAISYPGDGQGILKVRVSGSNEMVLNGTVSIKKKSGEMKTEKWSHKVKIMKPQGTISLPGMNVLYRNYDNELVGVASGYDETILTPVDNVKIVKKGNMYIGIPTAGRNCSISISGRNSVTKKTVNLGTQTFRIMDLPRPSLFLGSLESDQDNVTNGTLKGMTKLFVKYSKDILLTSNFNVDKWSLTLTHSQGSKTVDGSGPNIGGNANAANLLRMAKAGNVITISGSYTGPVNGRFKSFVLKVK
jgi:gliding motility-associated protein GldM